MGPEPIIRTDLIDESLGTGWYKFKAL